jgi:hypothetical protein
MKCTPVPGVEIDLPDDATQEEINRAIAPYLAPLETDFERTAKFANQRSLKIRDNVLKLIALRLSQGYSSAAMLEVFRTFKEPILLSLLGATELAEAAISQIEVAAQNLPEPNRTITLTLVRDFRSGLSEAAI